MAQIDTHRASYTRVNPNLRVGRSRPSKQSLIDRLIAIDADISRLNNANLPESERVLLERASNHVLQARRALRIMVSK